MMGWKGWCLFMGTSQGLRVLRKMSSLRHHCRVRLRCLCLAAPRRTPPALRLRINLGARCGKLPRFLFHTNRQCLVFRYLLFGGKLPHILRNLHRAEMWTAHGAEMCGLRSFLRQGLVVELTRGLRIEREVELIFPAKFEARF